jgi:drug/metabolite transporter superfamily protein YnfA
VILYALSSAPGPAWQDSGLFQYRVWHNDVEGFEGLAISHPLYHLVAIGAKYIPVGEFGRRVNLVSAVAAAFAVTNLYLLARLWLGRDFPAVIAAVTLAVAHTFWWHASIAETYTLWAALFLGELVLLLEYTKTKRVRYLYGLGLLNGLAIAVHMLAAIPLACYVVFLTVQLVRRSIRGRDLAIVAGLWVLGALPYEYLILKNMTHSGDVLGTLASAAFGTRWRGDVLNTHLSWKLVREDLLYLVLNFPTPNALLFFVGLAGLRRTGGVSGFRVVILSLLVLFFLFACRYTIVDRYAFFLPFYCVVALMIGWGSHELLSHVRHAAAPCLVAVFSVLPVAVYAAAPGLAQRLHLSLGTRQDIPYRNDYQYFLRPWRTGDTGPQRFAREALDKAEPGAIIYADSTTVPPLLYVQEVENLRPDVKIVGAAVGSPGAPRVEEGTMPQLLDEHPVYVVSRRPGYCPAFLLARYELAEAGVLWRVVRKS